MVHPSHPSPQHLHRPPPVTPPKVRDIPISGTKPSPSPFPCLLFRLQPGLSTACQSPAPCCVYEATRQPLSVVPSPLRPSLLVPPNDSSHIRRPPPALTLSLSWPVDLSSPDPSCLCILLSTRPNSIPVYTSCPLTPRPLLYRPSTGLIAATNTAFLPLYPRPNCPSHLP